MRRHRLLFPVLALAVVLSACGDDDEATSSSTTTPASTTTVTGPLAEGSGCTPGDGDLPDGRWFGLVEMAASDVLTFDLACWFVGDAAVVASAQDGQESPPPNDYYVRNENDAIRDVEVAASTMVVWYPEVGNPESQQTASYADWLVGRGTRLVQLAVWIEVEGGVVTAIEEQWVP